MCVKGPNYEINDLRNRLAHHEPLWKFTAIKDTSANPARTVVPATQSQADTLARFQRLMGLRWRVELACTL